MSDQRERGEFDRTQAAILRHDELLARAIAAEARVEIAERQVAAVEVLAKKWLRLSGQALDAEVREWTAAAGKSILSALAHPDGGGAS